MDRLDLLGIRHDVEMEIRAKYDLAKEISEYWKKNCNDEDFYKFCMDNISNKLGKNATYSEVKEVWNIIEENFLEDKEYGNIGDIENYKNHCVIKYRYVSDQYDVGFNDIYDSYSYFVIDKHELCSTIGNEICDLSNDIKKKFVLKNNDIDVETLAEWIDEEYLNDIRIDIQNGVEEYLNNHMEVDL